MADYKIVITGAYAAGKTQFIRSVSEIDVIDTEALASHADERLLKTHTTVGLDYGILTIDPEHRLVLFGTPGQERFDFMWEVLSEGCLGYVVLVDSCRPAYFAETTRLIERFAAITPAPFVVAANKQDEPGALPPAYIRRRLGTPLDIPILPCVASDQPAARDVLLALLERIAALSDGMEDSDPPLSLHLPSIAKENRADHHPAARRQPGSDPAGSPRYRPARHRRPEQRPAARDERQLAIRHADRRGLNGSRFSTQRRRGAEN